MNRFVGILAIGFAIMAPTGGCRSLDVVGETAVTSFEALLASSQLQVGTDPEGGSWVITAPGGEQFRWSQDFSIAAPDLALVFDASPFLAAGLEPEELPAERYAYDGANKRLIRQSEIGSSPFVGAVAQSPLATFRQIVESHRARIGYHAQFDHYGVDLGDGDMFEWAKDLSTNDKDIVFALAPEPFLAAGVDPTRLAGWTFGKVKVKDKSGQEAEVDKLLKPYDLQ